MGWIIFLGIVTIIVAIVVLVKVSKKNKCIEGLKNSGGYKVALQINGALIQAGFEIRYDSMLYYGDNHSGYWFYVNQNSVEIAEVSYDYYGGYKGDSNSYSLYKLKQLSEKNANADMVYQGGYYYAIYNDNLNILAEAKQKSQEIPTFLEIVAKEMLNSGYEFHHPKWMVENPESKNYLNVMFQTKSLPKGDYENEENDDKQKVQMDAVDYYNSGIRKMREQDFRGAENDFSFALHSNKSTASDTKELEMMAYLNRGIAHYNQALGKDMTEAVEKMTYAISDWEEVLRSDSNPGRKAQAQGLIQKVKQKRGF